MEHFLGKSSAKIGAPVRDGGQTDLDHPAPRAWSFKARWQTSALAPQLQRTLSCELQPAREEEGFF